MSNFSITALKKFRRMNKDQMVKAIVEVSNYAEQQKAASMLLMARLKQVEGLLSPEQVEQLKKLSEERQDVEPQPEGNQTKENT